MSDWRAIEKAGAGAGGVGPRCVAALREARPYAPPAAPRYVDLMLDANEAPGPAGSAAEYLRGLGEGGWTQLLRRYPSASALESLLARRLSVAASRVVATAGGDDALDRACRAVLAPGRTLILPVPTFEMIGRSAALAGAEILEIPWPGGAFPTEAVIDAISPATAAIAVVSPNNPTGAVASAADLRGLSSAAPGALLIVDLAYTEFADEDLTPAALELPNAVLVRTLSKAWGLAGLRVGYAVGPERIITWLRAAGGPFAVSGPACAAACAVVGGEMADEIGGAGRGPPPMVARVRAEREELASLLASLGARVEPSQANFIFARLRGAAWLGEALASLGIWIRRYPGKPGLADAVRITCPGEPGGFERLRRALRTALKPRALLWDMDGVLADVSESYRRAIVATAAAFGVHVSDADVTRATAAGHANNDWELTRRLLQQAGRDVSLAEVTGCFERLYQGHAESGQRGLRSAEKLIPPRGLLSELAGRLPMGVVTGRPRADAERFLREHEIDDLFGAVVCMEDGPRKPDPAPVRLALDRLGVDRLGADRQGGESAWMIGDTPDDVRAARAAGVVPIGYVGNVVNEADPLAAREGLAAAGVARVIEDFHEILEMLR